MKKFLPLIFLFFPFFAYATSGACSGHGGVDCNAGAGSYGQVICSDGWTGSSVSYASMVECRTSQPQPSTNTNNLFAMKQRCASYTSTIQNEITNLDVSSQANAKIHPGTQSTDILDEVFYSPVTNSCLYTEEFYAKSPGITIGTTTLKAFNMVTYFIRDYLDNESQIYAVVIDPVGSDPAKITQFYDTVDYYKGTTSSQTLAPPVPATPTPIPASSVPSLDNIFGTAPATPTSHKSPLIAGTKATATTSTTTTSTATSSQPKRAGPLDFIYHFISSFFKLF